MYNLLPKKIFLLLIVVIIFLPLLIIAAQAADIEAVLDTNTGSSNFSIIDSSGSNVVTRIDSDGNIFTRGCVRIDSTGVECSLPEGLIIDGDVGIGETNPLSPLHVNSADIDNNPIMTLENSGGEFRIFISQGNPNGSILANMGDVCIDEANGALYVKSTNGVVTGWNSLLAGGNFANETLSNLSAGSVAVNTDITADATSTRDLGSTTNAWAYVYADTLASQNGTDLKLNSASNTIEIEDTDIDLTTQQVSVSLNDSINALNFDSSTLSIDATNNRVGIGEAAPTQLLDVGGNATIGGYLTIEGDRLYTTTIGGGYLLVSNDAGEYFQPAQMQGDCTINESGSVNCSLSGGVVYNAIDDATADGIINFGASHNYWTAADVDGDDQFFRIDYEQADDADATDFIDVMRLDISNESQDAGDTLDGLAIYYEDGINNSVMDAGIRIHNYENTGSTMIDGIIIESDASGGIITGVNLSDSSITFALNLGTNDIISGPDIITSSELRRLVGKDAALVDVNDGATFTNHISVPAHAYGADWNGSNQVPTKNDIYDKIETVSGSAGGADTEIQYNNAGGFGGIANVIYDGTNFEFEDDQRLAFGTAADWLMSYELADNNTLSVQTALTQSDDPDIGMVTVAVDTGNAGVTPDQEVFELGKGAMDDSSGNFTELFSVDEDGDVRIAGTLTLDTTSLDETNAAGDNGATLVGVFDEFANSNATNVQDALDDLDQAIVAAGGGDITAIADCATGQCLDGQNGMGTYIRINDNDGGNQYVQIETVNVSANRTITLPDSDQTVGTATTLNGTIVNDTNMVAEDFGDFTCTGLEDGCTINANAVQTDEIDLSISPTWTGAHVYNAAGGASLAIPSAAVPTTDATGEIALDTDVTSHQPLMQYYDGVENLYVIALPVANLTTNDGDVIVYDAGASEFVMQPEAGGGGSPGGANTQLQYNNAGSFGGIATVIYEGGNLEIEDDIRLALGSNADWLMSYEPADNNTLSVQTALTQSDDPDIGMVTVAVDTGNAGVTPNQEVFEVGKGAMDDSSVNFTELFAVDEDGDATINGTISAGSGSTVITTATGTLDGDQIENDTIDEDSIDWGTGASQVSCADLPVSDCGAITAATLDTGSGPNELYDLPMASGADGDSATVQSDSGLEIVSGGITLLRGCNQDQILKWDEVQDDWNCSDDGGGAGGSPGGADTQLQYNNSGAFGGISNIVWDGTNLDFADDQRIAFGTDADWLMGYEVTDENTLSIQTLATGTTGPDNAMVTIAADADDDGLDEMTPDQEIFEIGKGAMDDGDVNFRELFSVDEDGDTKIYGTLTTGTAGFQITTATGQVDGNTIGDDTIDDDSIDFGAGIDQVSCTDLPMTDCGAITSTGVVDFSGATSLSMPNGAPPTTNATGEFALDTSIVDHQPLVQYYDGDENLYVVAMPTANLLTTNDYVVAYNAANNEFYMKQDAGGGGSYDYNDLNPLVTGNLNLQFGAYQNEWTVTMNNDNGFVLDFRQNNDGGADSIDALQIQVDGDGDATDTLDAIGVVFEAGSTSNMESGLHIENQKGTAASIVDGILIDDTSGTAGGIVDGIDVSDADITNAINIGNNPITEGTETFYYSAGNARWETSTDLHVNGALSKTSGTFDIPHPNPEKAKEGWHLRHSFVESPTRGDNLYRWEVEVKDGQAIIELPEYFKYLNENAQIWVSAKEHFGNAFGKVNEEQTQLIVKANSDGIYNVLAVATRKDDLAKKGFDKLGVEYKKEIRE